MKIVSRESLPTLVESMRATVRWETARAALKVPARDCRVVVNPRSRLNPAAETNAT